MTRIQRRELISIAARAVGNRVGWEPQCHFFSFCERSPDRSTRWQGKIFSSCPVKTRRFPYKLLSPLSIEEGAGFYVSVFLTVNPLLLYMNQPFFRKKIILDRISLGLVTFLIVILTQSRIAHSSDRPLPETTINRGAPVLSVDLERRSPQLPQKNLASIPDVAATNDIEKSRNLYSTGSLVAAISAWQTTANGLRVKEIALEQP